MTTTIKCRAKVSDDCYDGSPTIRQFGEDDRPDLIDEVAQEKCVGEGGHFLDEAGDCERCHYHEPQMSEDNTWNGTSIVCDACYLELLPFTPSGSGLNEELPEAIGHYHEQLTFIRRAADPQVEIDKVKKTIASARPGSPLRASGEACIRMAEKEIKRRATCQE
jgi:hypothetical protein